MKAAVQHPTKASLADSRAKWLARARKVTARQRLPMIEAKLRSLPKTPTTSNVFFRKKLLRLCDESRLEAGMVTVAQLQRENSPFAKMDFSTARIIFNPRLRG